MKGQRVIQDSDDELEDDLETEARSPPAANASAVQHERAKHVSSASGTGSTESLKREYAEAHRNHLQSPSLSTVPFQHEPQSSVSLPEHRSKRRRTSDDISPRNSPPTASSNQGPVTYGEEFKSITSSSLMHLIDEVIAVEAPANMFGHVHGASLGLEGTARDDYVQHDPMALFPEPSSTVPNATLTQQRVLAGVTAPALLGIESETGALPYQPPFKASVPWSDLLDFSPIDAREQSEPSNQQAELYPAAPFPSLPEPSQDPSTHRSRRGSSGYPRGSPSQHELLLGSVDTKDFIAPPVEIRLSQDLDFPPKASEKGQKEISEGNCKSLQEGESRLSSHQDSEDDLATVGLPEEHYKPRPSHSRSLKIDAQENLDYSVRPEKAVNVAKRRKTTTTAITTRSTQVADLTPTPQKVQQICDMGFTPTSTERALRKMNGNVTQTVEWLISNGMGEDELAPRNIPRRKAASKVSKSVRTDAVGEIPSTAHSSAESNSVLKETELSKLSSVATEPVAEATNMNDTMAISDTAIPSKAGQLKSPKVQVVIPSKSPKQKPQPKHDSLSTSTKKAKRRKTTLDTPEPESVFDIPVEPEVTTQKKKGRGRPKKAANATLPTEIVQKVPQETPEELEDGHGKILQTIEPNMTTPTTSILSGIHASEDVQNQPPAPITLPNNPHSAVPSRTPDQLTKPVSRSPGSKGKASYRVGLSKRARIAPLLRTLKK